MNKKCYLLLFPLFGLTLASCTDTEELYNGNAYVTASFVDNAYSIYHPRIEAGKNNISGVKTLQNEEHGYFNGSGDYSSPSTCAGFGQARSWHEDWFKNADGTELFWVSGFASSSR